LAPELAVEKVFDNERKIFLPKGAPFAGAKSLRVPNFRLKFSIGIAATPVAPLTKFGTASPRNLYFTGLNLCTLRPQSVSAT
jgi:hypothetical protein